MSNEESDRLIKNNHLCFEERKRVDKESCMEEEEGEEVSLSTVGWGHLLMHKTWRGVK